MAELENNKDLMSVLWSGADILRSKMDANEYKNYLLGIVFYKYLSDSFLIKAYDLIYDEKPETLKIALDAYKEAVEDESGEELKEEIRSEFHYVIEPELTYTSFAQAANDNSFNREQLQKAFNNIEQSDEIFADLFHTHPVSPLFPLLENAFLPERIRTDLIQGVSNRRHCPYTFMLPLKTPFVKSFRRSGSSSHRASLPKCPPFFFNGELGSRSVANADFLVVLRAVLPKNREAKRKHTFCISGFCRKIPRKSRH